MIHTFVLPCLLDPAFNAWVESSVALIVQYGDAFHADDPEGCAHDAAYLCMIADHLWREQGDREPSWARLDVEAVLAELAPPEGPRAIVSLLIAFVTFLCQRSVLGPMQTVKLLNDLERVGGAHGDRAAVEPRRRWAKMAQA